MPGSPSTSPSGSSWGSTKVPRRIDRRTVPAIGISIRADFHGHVHGHEGIHSGVLWDVSPMGACVWFPSLHLPNPSAPLAGGRPGELHIHHPAHGENLVMAARLAWIDQQVRATYIGLEFLEEYDFSNTFLRLLLAAA